MTLLGSARPARFSVAAMRSLYLAPSAALTCGAACNSRWKASPSRRMVSVATAARTVAERGASDISAISPTYRPAGT